VTGFDGFPASPGWGCVAGSGRPLAPVVSDPPADASPAKGGSGANSNALPTTRFLPLARRGPRGPSPVAVLEQRRGLFSGAFWLQHPADPRRDASPARPPPASPASYPSVVPLQLIPIMTPLPTPPPLAHCPLP